MTKRRFQVVHMLAVARSLVQDTQILIYLLIRFCSLYSLSVHRLLSLKLVLVCLQELR